MDFVSELVRKRKENLQKFIKFIVEIFQRYFDFNISSTRNVAATEHCLQRVFPIIFLKFHVFCSIFFLRRYDESPPEYKPYRQKDGALLAIGALCDKLKQTEPYKSELERMLVQHVFPEFKSPVGHLRAKVSSSFPIFIFLVIHKHSTSSLWKPKSANLSTAYLAYDIVRN